MRLNGRAFAAAAFAVSVSCAGSVPPPVTRPPAPPASPAAPSGATIPEPPPRGTAALAGRVVHADGRGPLPRARVILTSPALTEPRVLITGADGGYEFDNLPAGRERRTLDLPLVSLAAARQTASR